MFVWQTFFETKQLSFCTKQKLLIKHGSQPKMMKT